MPPNHVKIRILDEVSMVIVGLRGEHTEYFHEKYGVYAPNYFFNPKYKLGQWDGKIRYFHKKNNKTFLYLIDDILPRVVELGYKVQVEDLRMSNICHPEPIKPEVFKHVIHLETGEPIELREDQVDGMNSLLEHGYGICLAGTGGGKTLMCAALVNAYDKHGVKSITIVPSENLIGQTKAEYINCSLDTGEYSGTEKTLDHQHIVSTWQCLQNNPMLVNEFQMIIVDECLDENTLITMSSGQQKKIKDVVIGDKVLSYNIERNQFETDNVAHLHVNLLVSSTEKMYRLEFDDGRELEITGNHKILTTSGYIRADELTNQHEVVAL
ncbi:MAG: hypothetical protein E4H14_02405 [Candidatus Thorarchaeota archaeon]|nr:MAG: hypothetical protein E4H14_02405 [Candidatus Thorarchaeota archaeon]